MLALQEAEGLPPQFAIAGRFEMEALAPREPWEEGSLSLSLSGQVTPRGHTPPSSTQLEGY